MSGGRQGANDLTNDLTNDLAGDRAGDLADDGRDGRADGQANAGGASMEPMPDPQRDPSAPAPAPTSLARVLVADDDDYITDLVATGLRFMGYEVDVAASGHEALTKAAAGWADLILLDVLMPDRDGFEVCRRLRSEGNQTPIIFLTASAGLDEKVSGLRLGADDYMTKPFRLEEVVARIETVLRRAGKGPAATLSRLEVADLELDEDAHTVRRAGRRIDLSATEFKVLRYLMANAGRVVSRAQILDHVWQYDFGGTSTVVETYVSYLRRKVDDREPHLIHTIRGIGYVMRVEDP